MIWLACALLALATLLPLLLALHPRASAVIDRREADIALYRAQTAELARDLEQGRISSAEHDAAAAEISRRLLAADTAPARRSILRSSSLPVLLAFTLVPALGFALYLYKGHPELPALPFVEAQRMRDQEDTLINLLRARLLTLDQTTERTREGWLLLANAERNRQNYTAAVDAYKRALEIRFDPDLAFQIGTMLMAARGEVTEETRDYYRRALEAAPPNARWRGMAEQLLSQENGTR